MTTRSFAVVVLLPLAAVWASGCGGTSAPTDANRSDGSKTAIQPDSVKGDTAFYSTGGIVFATFDGVWHQSVGPLGGPFDIVTTVISIELVNTSDTTDALVRHLIRDAGMAICYRRTAASPLGLKGLPLYQIVIPDPPLTPTLEEMNAAFGEAQIAPSLGLVRRYQCPLRAEIPLIESLNRFLDRSDVVRSVWTNNAGEPI